MIRRYMLPAFIGLALCGIGFGAPAHGANCNTVSIVDMPWTGNLVKSETAAWILDELGYKATVHTANLGLAREFVAQQDNGISFGLWLPTARTPFGKYMLDGTFNIVATNVKGARLTLAVPQYVYDAGVTNQADLDKYRDRFGGKIYGLGPGTDNNESVKDMIMDDAYGLGDWQLVESSEAGMLAAVKRKIAHHDWVVFIGWTPHPMNIILDMAFLDGGDKYWGPNGGQSSVSTFVSRSYAWRCRNVGQFLKNYWFELNEQSMMSNFVIADDLSNLAAGKRLIRENPGLLKRWLGHGGMLQDGPVMTADGKQKAATVISQALEMTD